MRSSISSVKPLVRRADEGAADDGGALADGQPDRGAARATSCSKRLCPTKTVEKGRVGRSAGAAAVGVRTVGAGSAAERGKVPKQAMRRRRSGRMSFFSILFFNLLTAFQKKVKNQTK